MEGSRHDMSHEASRHRLDERTLKWWSHVVDSEEAATMWGRWCEQINGHALTPYHRKSV
jgi:hypothetical protein